MGMVNITAWVKLRFPHCREEVEMDIGNLTVSATTETVYGLGKDIKQEK